MTIAVCWKCGSQKIGALTPCPRCSAEPRSPEEKAKSLLLSDHHRDAAELQSLGRQIEHGTAFEFDEAEVARVAAAIQSAPPKPSLGCRLLIWLPIAILLLLLAGVLALASLGAYR